MYKMQTQDSYLDTVDINHTVHSMMNKKNIPIAIENIAIIESIFRSLFRILAIHYQNFSMLIASNTS